MKLSLKNKKLKKDNGTINVNVLCFAVLHSSLQMRRQASHSARAKIFFRSGAFRQAVTAADGRENVLPTWSRGPSVRPTERISHSCTWTQSMFGPVRDLKKYLYSYEQLQLIIDSTPCFTRL
jgi:hypothetical protein